VEIRECGYLYLVWAGLDIYGEFLRRIIGWYNRLSLSDFLRSKMINSRHARQGEEMQIFWLLFSPMALQTAAILAAVRETSGVRQRWQKLVVMCRSDA